MACLFICQCDVGDVPIDTAAGVVEFVKRVRVVARAINTSIAKQSNDREFRFAVENVRHLAASDDLPGVVRPGENMAVAFVVGTLYVIYLICLLMYSPPDTTMVITISMQIVKDDGDEYLDVHLGEIVQLTLAFRKNGIKKIIIGTCTNE